MLCSWGKSWTKPWGPPGKVLSTEWGCCRAEGAPRGPEPSTGSCHGQVPGGFSRGETDSAPSSPMLSPSNSPCQPPASPALSKHPTEHPTPASCRGGRRKGSSRLQAGVACATSPLLTALATPVTPTCLLSSCHSVFVSLLPSGCPQPLLWGTARAAGKGKLLLTFVLSQAIDPGGVF